MLANVRDFLNTVPKQPQLQCSTADQARGLATVCRALGMTTVANQLEQAFQPYWSKPVEAVIDLTLLPDTHFADEYAPAFNQCLMASALANRFGLYDVADYLRLRVVDTCAEWRSHKNATPQ